MNWPHGSMRRADLTIIADTYLRCARQCYLRWGALGKVKQLDQLHPHLREEVSQRRSDKHDRRARGPTRSSPLCSRVSKAVSGEMVLEKLIEFADAHCDRACRR